jgi:pimeloyl-ACP methyl ester carboxylesterase
MLFGPRAIPIGGPLAARTLLRPADAVVLPLLWHAIFAPQRMPRRFSDEVPLARLSEPSELIATGEDAIAYIADLARNTPLYPLCHVPVRIVAGTADAVVNNRTQGYLLSRTMPDCTFEELPGLGHMLHHFRPDRVADLVEALSRDTAADS